MVAVKTGFSSPSMPGMPAPMQPMGGLPPMPPMGGAPAPNPFAPMPPMPLAGMPPPPMMQPPMAQPPMARPPMPQQVSNAPRRKRFGDSLETMLGRNQGIGSVPQQRPLPMPPQMMPQQRMVAPGTPMMRTPPMGRGMPRPMAMGGEVDIFGYEDGGPVQYMEEGGLKLGSGGYGGHSSTYGIEQARDSGGNLVPGMFVAKYADGTYSKPVTAANVEGLRQGLLSGNVTSGDYTASEASDMASKDLYLRSNDIAVTDRDVSGGFGSPLGMSNEMLGNDTVFVRFGDGTVVTAQKGMVDAMNEYGLLEGMGSRDDFNKTMLDMSAASVRDPESELAAASRLANDKIVAYNQALRSSDPNIQKNIDAFRGYYAPESTPAVDTGVDQIPSSAAGPGTAVDAPANFSTGTYDDTGFFGSGATNYDDFTGSVGDFSETPESSALYGPKLNMPQRVSQYYTDPVTGGLTTTFGPQMSAISPIGGAILPARPVEIDIFDFLSSPTYGSLLSNEVEEMANGGTVPRQTSIGDQPHMLAYINQDEEALLRSFGGSGLPGPGGIPTYRPSDYAAERAASSVGGGRGTVVESAGERAAAIAKEMAAKDDNDNKISSTGPSGYTSLDAIAAAATADDKPSVTVSAFDDDDEDYTPTSAQLAAQLAAAGQDDLRSDTSVVDYTKTGSDKDFTTAAQEDTDVSGAEFVSLTSGSPAPVTGGDVDIFTPTLASEEALPAPVVDAPVVYTDNYGRQHSSQAEADAANRAIAAQAVSYGLGQQGFNRFAATARDSGFFDTPEQANQAAARAYPTYLENYNEGRALRDFDEAPFTYTGIGGIGGGDATSGGTGMTPAPITPPQLPSDESGFSLSDADKALFEVGAPPVIDLGTSVFLDPDAGDPRGDQIVSPTGTGIGRESDLQRGLGATASTVRDIAPPEEGYTSLSNIKDRISRAEGTADEGGYDRLLGGTEDRFGIKPTEMTVQEVLDFQSNRGEGSYADYAKGAVGRISTPVGKYQVVGTTLQSLVDQGIIDANAKFDAATQEKIGTHLVMNDLAGGKGLSDLKSGDITADQFEVALGKQFEGIERGLDKGAGASAGTLNIVDEAVRQIEQGRRDENVEKIKAQIGDQAEPTGVENVFYNIIGGLGFGLGKGLADDLRGKSREERQTIINQHVYALENGATPKTDEEGNYIGFDISTMDTFADKVLAADDISVFLPGGAEDADGDGVSDYDRFRQVYDAQSEAAKKDPFGQSTEQGFITSDGKEFFVDAGGNVVEVTDSVVPFEVGGGDDVTDIFTATTTTTDDDDDGGSDTGTDTGVDTGHTVDEDGNIVCNTEGYIYNPETKVCEPKKEEETGGDLGSPISRGTTSRSFDDILAGITTPAPNIAPISANIRPMQSGGMAGLNRAADNFLKALAG